MILKINKLQLIIYFFCLVLYFGEKVKTCGEQIDQIENEFPSNSHPLYKKFVLFCLKSNSLFENPNGGIKIIKILLKSLKDTLLPDHSQNIIEK